jgi:hypothetical protein
MSNRCKKIVLLLAFLVMPMQGVAATLAVLVCHGDAGTHAMHEQPGHDHDAGTAHHDHGAADNRDGGASGSALYHLCCNLTAVAPPIAALPAAPADFPVRALAPDPLHDLYFPDQPQRPPLA